MKTSLQSVVTEVTLVKILKNYHFILSVWVYILCFQYQVYVIIFGKGK